MLASLASPHELRRGDSLSEHPAIAIFELAERERLAAWSVAQPQPLAGQLPHQVIVLPPRMAVSEAAARMTPEVAVEQRADVPQLVNDGAELFLIRVLAKSRQVKAQQVQELATVGVVQPLYRQIVLATFDRQSAVCENARV